MTYSTILISLLFTAGVALGSDVAVDSTSAPVIAPIGQVIDRTVPAYQPKFLAVAPLAGQYEERRWAYFNTYPFCPFWCYGGFGCNFGWGGFGSTGTGASIQNNTQFSQ